MLGGMEMSEIFVSLECPNCEKSVLYVKTRFNNHRRYCSKQCQKEYYHVEKE